jgi:hypothetical protein
MAGITHRHRVLKDQLEIYWGGLDAVKYGERMYWDPTRVWQQKAAELTKEIMEKSGRCMGRGTDEDDSPLVALRRAMGGIADYVQAITELGAEPNEDNLRLLGQDLNKARGSLMSLGRTLMLSQDPTLAASAHELVAEAEEALRVGQQRVRAALKRIGATSDISEIESEDGLLCYGCPIPGKMVGGQTPSSLFDPSRWRPQVTEGQGSDVAELIRCLSMPRPTTVGGLHSKRSI